MQNSLWYHEIAILFRIIPVFLSNCSPNDMTGIADAKNIQVVGAKILNYEIKCIYASNMHQGSSEKQECQFQ